MSAISIQPSYPIFTGTNGQPLDDGYIWIGLPNLDPQTNPASVYWDPELTQLAGQPIRTLAGRPVNNGTPARLYVNDDYSVRVMDKTGRVVYGAQSATERYNRSVVAISFASVTEVGTGVQTSFALASEPLFVYIGGVHQNKSTYSYGIGGVTFSEAPPLNAEIEFLI